MFDANYISQEVVRHIKFFMPATWIQNNLNITLAPNTIENRNIIRYNLRIFTRIFLA